MTVFGHNVDRPAVGGDGDVVGPKEPILGLCAPGGVAGDHYATLRGERTCSSTSNRHLSHKRHG